MNARAPADGRQRTSVAERIEQLADSGAAHDGFIVRHRIDRDERARVLESVFLDSDPRWGSAFVVMLVLSAGIATLGLSQNSAATVIGSMIVAPLGGPIVALGGAIAAVWPRQVARMGVVVLGGAALVVAVAYVLGLLLPNATPNAQILARTNPDLRDLGVAVFAGAAGAYARTRPSQLDALVGVAIAVALVPPLGAMGLMLEEGRWTLAQGALTLFAANFVGMTLSAAVTLLLTGFVPLPRPHRGRAGLAIGVAAVAAITAVVMIPLVSAYRSAIQSASTQSGVYAQAARTIGQSGNSTTIDKIDINGQNVTIDVANPDDAPDAAQFEADLIDELGPNVSVTLK